MTQKGGRKGETGNIDGKFFDLYWGEAGTVKKWVWSPEKKLKSAKKKPREKK